MHLTTSWTSRLRFLFLVFGLLALSGAGSARAHGTPATAVPFQDGGYRYQVVSHGAVPGFEAVGFDDSGWSVGAAGFGTLDGPCWWNQSPPVATTWPADTDILVRKTFELPAGAHNLAVFGNIDNNATVYLNGVQIGYVESGSCWQNMINVAAPDNLLVAGTNVLAIRGYGDYAYSFLDVSVTYEQGPAYGICALYDQSKAHRAGATVPIKIQLCDASGANLSSPDIVVHATGLMQIDGTASGAVEDAGNANPDADFRYDPNLGGYIFNLSTGGLASGTWQLSFTVNGQADPGYAVQFDVK